MGLFNKMKKVADDTDLDTGIDVGYIKNPDNLIVFTGAAGGVGVSTIVSNVAYMASKSGKRVLVIDMNIMYPIQHNYFGIQQNLDRDYDLVSLAMGKSSIGESLVNKKNISLLYANNRSIVDYVNLETDMAVNNIKVIIDKLRQLYDLILVDLPFRLEHTMLNTLLYISDKVYLVWDEGISSIANTGRLKVNMDLTGIETKKIKVILNKRTSINYSRYPFEKLNLELIGILPFDVDIIESGLRAEVFCDKGTSSSKNVTIYYNEINKIVGDVLNYRE